MLISSGQLSLSPFLSVLLVTPLLLSSVLHLHDSFLAEGIAARLNFQYPGFSSSSAFQRSQQISPWVFSYAE